MDAEGKEAMPAAKLVEEVNAKGTMEPSDELACLGKSNTNPNVANDNNLEDKEAMPAAKLVEEVNAKGTVEPSDELACLGKSNTNPNVANDDILEDKEPAMDAEGKEAMPAAKLVEEVNAKCTVEPSDELACLGKSNTNPNVANDDILEDKNTAFNNKVQALQNNKELLTTTLKHTEEKVTALNNELQVLRNDKEILTTNLNKAEAKVIELTNEMQALHRHQEVLESNLNKAVEELTAANNKVQALENNKEILTTNVKQAEEKVTALNNELQGLHNDKEILMTNLKNAEEKVIELTDGMQALHRHQEVLEISLNRTAEKLSAGNNEVGALQNEKEVLKTNINEAQEKVTALNIELQTLHKDKEILTTDLKKAQEKVTALNSGMQTQYMDQEVLKGNLNKAEEEAKLLSSENKGLDEANKKLLSSLEIHKKNKSERKHSASTSTKDEVAGQAGGSHSVLQIEHGNDQESSEGEEPTDLDPKDKGLFNFLKAVSNVACTATNAFNIGFVVLAYTASGDHATNELQKRLLEICAMAFVPFSLVTSGMAHSLEGKAKDIDMATSFVFGEIAYSFGMICLVAMFVAKAPWYVVAPLCLAIWSLTNYWLVTRYRRPRWLYRKLRSVKKGFKRKGHRR